MTSEIVILITELRNKQRITLPAGSYRFGRSAQCEYVLRRNNVGDHQFTVSFANGQWGVTDGGSDYRTWYNNRYLEPGETSILQSGDVVGLNTDGDADTQEITFRVEEITSVQGDGMAPKKEQTTDAVLRETDIRRKRRVLIGRGDDCDIKLVNDRVSRHHCEILYKDGHYELHDLGSTNGTYVDGVRVTRTVLRNGAVINVPAQVFAFTGGMLHYHAHQSGISIQLVNVYKTVKNANTGKPLNIVDGTSLQVEPNSFVVLVGGSGTGKSSLLTCITGTAPCTAGSVKFDGLDTRSNRNAFEAALGYVPQKDIMHDNLTVEQSLTYTAKLRIAHDATRAEIAAAVAHAIEAVDLQGREKTFISKLSGGQKKRVSIAMELLANPRLLILDEPTSGLSPDLDRSMMELCRRLSHQNCTVLEAERIKHVSSKLLAGQSVRFAAEFPVQGTPPAGVDPARTPAEADFALTLSPAGDALHLVPRIGVLGIGCRRGTCAEQLEAAFADFCARHSLAPACIAAAASIDLKADEAGLLAFCRAHGWPITFYSAEQLRALSGPFTPSPFVQSVTGVDNVCERAAVLASGGCIRIPKQAGGGVTFALALCPYAPDWRWQNG